MEENDLNNIVQQLKNATKRLQTQLEINSKSTEDLIARAQKTQRKDSLAPATVVSSSGLEQNQELAEEKERLEDLVREYRETCDTLLLKNAEQMDVVKTTYTDQLQELKGAFENEKKMKTKLLRENIILKGQVQQMREVMGLAIEKDLESELELESFITSVQKENAVLRKALFEGEAAQADDNSLST